MKFKIPFTVSPLEKLAKKSKPFSKFVKHKRATRIQGYLDNSNIDLSREQYVGIVLRNLLKSVIFFAIVFTTFLFLLGVNSYVSYGIYLTILFSGFILVSQMMYPRLFSRKREKDIERNLMPTLEDILVQLNSGIPLFSILVNISDSNYGELSVEFRKAVKKINAGISEVTVLEELGDRNSSVFFRRVLWQISNGLRAGSDMQVVIRDSIEALSGEQLIQIQTYGNKLNPFIMFYMLVSVIIPALSVTFLTILSSMINLPENMTMLIFIALFILVIFVQIMFIGLIKSARPNLL